MTTFYLLRHGEIESDGIRRFVGQADIPLTPRGVEQAHGWRDAFSGIPFEKIYASDLSRCADTARIIAGDTGTDIHFCPELREIHLGKLEGLAMADFRQRFQNEWAARGEDISGYVPEGGESFAGLGRRVIPVVAALANRHDGNVLLVTHAGVNRVILCHALGMPLDNLFRIEQSYGCLNLLEWEEDAFRVLGVNLAQPSGSL
jgi:probable phosphoglycerate mutase